MLKYSYSTNILAIALAFMPAIASAHCLIPEESVFDFRCNSDDGVVEIRARAFDTVAEPRACASEIFVQHKQEGANEGWEHSFVGGSPIYRGMEPGVLETIIAFGQQNSFSIWRRFDETKDPFKGYIEFAGGPHWYLKCDEVK